MENNIHETAIIGENVVIGKGNTMDLTRLFTTEYL